MAIQSKRLYSILVFFTLDYWFLLSVRQYFKTGWKRKMFYAAFLLYNLGLFHVYSSVWISMYFIKRNDYIKFREYYAYMFSMTRNLFDDDPLMLFSMVFGDHFLFYVVYFSYFCYTKRMFIESVDMDNFFKILRENHLTMLSSLISDISKRNFKQACKSISHQIEFKMNPFLIPNDVYELILSYRRFEISFFGSMLYTTICILFVFAVFWCTCVVSYTARTLFEQINIQIVIVLAIYHSCWLVLISTFIVKVQLKPWLRYSKEMENLKFEMIKYNRTGKSYKEKNEILLAKLCNGRKIFFQTLFGMIRINKHVISDVVSISIFLSLITNLIFVTKFITQKLPLVLAIYLPLVSIIQFSFFFIVVYLIGFKTTQLYSPSKLYLNHYVNIDTNSKKKHYREISVLNKFIEIIHTEESFAFTLGGLGSISQRLVLGVVSIYSSLVMCVVPYTHKNNTLKL